MNTFYLHNNFSEPFGYHPGVYIQYIWTPTTFWTEGMVLSLFFS
jgi:hypothetical protein